MSKNPREDQLTASDTPTARQAEFTVEELPALPISNEKAEDVKGGLNPQPLPPRWVPGYLELPAVQFEE